MTPDELNDLVQRLRGTGTDNAAVEAKAASWALPKDLWQTLSAFSNTLGGGTVILGLNEQTGFGATGLADPKKMQADVSALCTEMEPPLRPLIEQHEVDGNEVLVVELAELPVNQKPCYLKARGLVGGAYTRVGDSNRQLSQYEVQLTLASHGQPLDDIKPTDATRADLDDTLVGRLLGELRARPGSPFTNQPDDDVLMALRVLVIKHDQISVSRAGLLALGRYPQQFVPQVQMTFVSYPTENVGAELGSGERFLDNERFEGPIPSIVEQAITRVKMNMRRGAVVRGAYRNDQWEYPETAIREALVNALVHRDLSDAALGSPAQVQKFPDRIEIQNPGGLYGPVTVDQLGDTGVSSARNGFLLRILEDLHVCENRGSGIGAMVAAMRAADLAPPEFEDGISFFRVTFPNHTLMGEETSAWLAGLLHPDLTESQRIGLALMHENGAITNATYRRATGADSRIATRELADLVARGLASQSGVRRWTTYELATQEARPPTQMSLTVTGNQVPYPVLTVPPVPQEEASIDARIIDAVQRHGPLLRQEIERQLDLPPRGSRAALSRLIESGKLVPTTAAVRSPNRRYQLAKQGAGSTRTTG